MDTAGINILGIMPCTTGNSAGREPSFLHSIATLLPILLNFPENASPYPNIFVCGKKNKIVNAYIFV